MNNFIYSSFDYKSFTWNIWVWNKNYKINVTPIKFKCLCWESWRWRFIHSFSFHCLDINQNDSMSKFLIIQNVVFKSDKIVRFWPFQSLPGSLELNLWSPNWSFCAKTYEIALVNWASHMIHKFLGLVHYKRRVYILITLKFPLRNPHRARAALSWVKKI